MKHDPPPITRPIFLVGSGRSGTTVLYHVLCGHPHLAWFSNYNERFPRLPQVARGSRLYALPQLRALRGRGLPVPSEAYAVWDFIRPVADSPGDPPLDETHVTAGERERMHEVIAANLRYHGKSRFVNKNTRNTRRIRYLQNIFPDAIFIHVVRDPRAAIASLLKVDWWPHLKIWCQNQITAQQWARQGKDPALLATDLWIREVRCVLEAKTKLPPRQYFEVRYEEFMQTPKEVLQRMLAFCGLEWTGGFESFVAGFALQSMNFKFRNQFTPQQLAMIEEMVAPLARQLGYDIPARRTIADEVLM